MTQLPGPLRALAATARAANLPSVVSNTWLGILLAGGPATGNHASAATAAAICLYLSGTFINDWADHRWDIQHRPERALPRRLFAPALYLGIAVFMGVLAIGAAALVSQQALAVTAAILISIGIYTWLHKKSAWAVIPMGICRGLLPLLGLATAASPITSAAMLPVAVLAGVGLFLHVAAISWLARGESRPSASTGNEGASLSRLAHGAFASCFVLMAGGAYVILGLPAAVCLVGVVPYVIWTGIALWHRHVSVAGKVSALLAGIPLVDWALLLPLHLSQYGGSVTPLVCASGICLWLPPCAFILGRLLQRLSPAT